MNDAEVQELVDKGVDPDRACAIVEARSSGYRQRREAECAELLQELQAAAEALSDATRKWAAAADSFGASAALERVEHCCRQVADLRREIFG